MRETGGGEIVAVDWVKGSCGVGRPDEGFEKPAVGGREMEGGERRVQRSRRKM